MEINFTLFAQMGNFALAYCLLRYLLFKPALSVLDAQEQQLCAAKNTLQEHEVSLNKQRQRVEQAWQACQEQFKQRMPARMVGDSLFFRGIAPAFKPDPVSEGQYREKRHELEQTIIKEVARVRS